MNLFGFSTITDKESVRKEQSKISFTFGEFLGKFSKNCISM